MKVIKIRKKPTWSEVIEVTKRELLQAKVDCPSISLGNRDEEWLKQFSENDFVGVIAGEIQRILKPEAIFPEKTPDIWFINKDYLYINYTTLEKI